MAQAAHVAAAAISAIAEQAKTPLLVDSVNAIRGTAGKLEAWFGSMMDRVAQKFAMYMRLWTVLFASAIAFATGLNSITLLGDLYHNSALRSSLAGAAPQPPEIRSTAEGAAWIEANTTAERRAAALSSFDASSAAASQKVLQDAAQNAARTAAVASQTGFDILKGRWPAKPDAIYLLGVLITAALLSLGAPFWFNALKSMSNLRPILATKEKAEEK
jgi:hypothetical protein